MKSLVQIQEEALERLKAERSSPRRRQRLVGSVSKWYRRELEAIGIAGELERQTWRDVLDMDALRITCEEA